jgi:putative hemolysin
MEYIELVIVAGMVLVNAIFAAYEIALASVSVVRLQFLVSQKKPGAQAALFMKDGIERSLAVVQLGITLVGLVAGATGGASATDDLAPILGNYGLGPTASNVLAICLIVVPLTAVTIVVGELMPKLFALRHKEWVCLILSPAMRFFALSVWPVVWFLEFSATGLMDLLEKHWRPSTHLDPKAESAELQELRTIASMARTSRLIGAREENIILGAARLASRPLMEIVLPAEHIRTLKVDANLMDSLIAAHLDLHTRFPVSEEENDPQTIVGYVAFKDIVTTLKMSPSEPTLHGIVRPIPNLDSNIPISAALEFLLKEHTHIAIVRDATKRVVGMITLEDIVEELVGDIQDEHDQLPIHITRSGSGWIVGGGATLGRLKEITHLDLPGGVQQNLSSWVIERLGASPNGSEVIRHQGIRVLVRKIRRQRVLEANLTIDAQIRLSSDTTIA